MAEVAADALEQASGADIPVADENLTWADMIARIADAVGRRRRVARLPAGAAKAALRLGGALQALARKESGVNPSYLADLLLAELFIEPTTGRPLDPALRETFARQRLGRWSGEIRGLDVGREPAGAVEAVRRGVARTRHQHRLVAARVPCRLERVGHDLPPQTGASP